MAPKRSREMLASKSAMRLRSSGRCLPAIAEDRLSSLQDCILHCIMSFLTARQAVRTCVLSRRWSNLWRSMPCLDIDQREFDAAAPGASRYRFVEFVDRLLMLHDASSLDKFRCHVNHGCEFKVVDPWIRHGIRCSPAVMEVSSSSRRSHVDSWVFPGIPNFF
ncbi:F-box/LRR-repeat protein At3g58930-like [Panicum virgatum]|uniref:F-box/LRR-repeat protein At3g58930-like n=1 Tax=Panicum virgatum TaxID=38727 RepID=UPI0019D6526C|nr:F-box/LRR-repeat protein At3g58930-like [Panicum virgatum]